MVTKVIDVLKIVSIVLFFTKACYVSGIGKFIKCKSNGLFKLAERNLKGVFNRRNHLKSKLYALCFQTSLGEWCN